MPSKKTTVRVRTAKPYCPSSAASSSNQCSKTFPRKDFRTGHGPIRRMGVRFRLLVALGLVSVLLPASYYYYYYYTWGITDGGKAAALRSVTPLDAPKMMDLPQFQGEHKESLYWGTYRPHVYLGIRARTPKSLLAGLMWIGIKNGQYFLRHVCQDSDDLQTYGWTEHNGRDYGHQLLIDHGLILTTSFFKYKGQGSGYGGDWAVRVNVEQEKSSLEETQWNPAHIFFYVADEGGHSLDLNKAENFLKKKNNLLLAFGSRKDVGAWELHMASEDDFRIHYSGLKTPYMHNLTDLLQGILAVNAQSTGHLQLPDKAESNSNVVFFQVSSKAPFTFDVSFLSATGAKSSRTKERVIDLSGTSLTAHLRVKEKEYENHFTQHFNITAEVGSNSVAAGKSAISNLLGGIGYFYGQSKIALADGFHLANGDKYINYWPAALFTAVPSRSFFPRGFLWDEGFHQLLVWRWDVDISLDIIGHWLDLINLDGWIPREQILGAEALSKVPNEFVLQHPTNGNPPTLFLVFWDMINGMKGSKFSDAEHIKISAFLGRAFDRLDAWFKWFNMTQSGKEMYTYYWHGRDKTTTRELNPKTLMSGLDDYPRASHPSGEERHVDLRCWMYLAANCMQSIAEILGMKNGAQKRYHRVAEHLSNFEVLNQMHFDNTHGAYFDHGNHTEKVRLRWFEFRDGDNIKRELRREVLERPQLSLVPYVGYVSLFPFMMGIIPPDSWILEKQLNHIANRSTLWTNYGILSLAKTSSLYMKYNTEHDSPYWRGPIWINMNYLILSALHYYSQEVGPHKAQAKTIYEELRGNLIRNVVKEYHKTGFLWEQYDPKGKGKRAHPFTGWTALVVLIMSESYQKLEACC